MESTSDSKNNSKTELIKSIFQSMDYADDLENLHQASEWLKGRGSIFAYVEKKNENPNGEIFPIKNRTNDNHLCDVYVPESTTIDTILKKVAKSKNTWLEISAVERVRIIYKLGTEIQKKQELFTQLEVVARGILSKDTKAKTLPLLIDYLHYYSGFCVETNSYTPKGVVVAIIPDNNALWAFGQILGPCLAAGNRIILQCGPKLSPVTTLLIELSVQIGVPEGTIRIVPGNVDPNVFFTHSEVSAISIYDDLYSEKYLIANDSGKKLIHYNSSAGASMIVFDNSDLDSAYHVAKSAAFDCNGMLPHSVRNIYVQESVFDIFIKNFKHQTKQIQVGKSNMKNVDVSYPDDGILDKIKKIVQTAKNEGVEIYQPNVDNIPILFIGSNAFPNNVIKEDFMNVPIITVVAFRSINEAVTLANNTRQGLAVSIWTESTSLVNEIVGKLNVSNVWINSHGLFSADITTSPYKTSGNAFFGGSDGYYEYIQTNTFLKNESIGGVQEQNKEVMEKAIAEAKKAQVGWVKLNRFEREKNLQLTAQDIHANKNTWNLPEKWVDDWIMSIYGYRFQSSEEKFTKYKNYNVITTREPCGIIAIETSNNIDDHNKKLIISALSEGNAVIILNESKETSGFYSYMSKLLPKSVFTVVSQSQDAVKVAAFHRELNVYIGEKDSVFCSLPLKNSSKFKAINSTADWKELRNKITLVKNIWLNKGQSFM